MGRKRSLTAELRKFKLRLSRQLPVERMILFGSRAAGRAHVFSDVDLIIVSPAFRGAKTYERPLGFFRFWELDEPVDFLCYTPEEFRKLSKMATIAREAVNCCGLRFAQPAASRVGRLTPRS